MLERISVRKALHRFANLDHFMSRCLGYRVILRSTVLRLIPWITRCSRSLLQRLADHINGSWLASGPEQLLALRPTVLNTQPLYWLTKLM